MPKKNDSKDNAMKAAQKYVDEQIATLKRYGSAGRISKSSYKSMVRQVARVSAS